MPKVSICIPTYNNVGEVKRLLDSIRQQTYQDIEIIITDDSTNEEIEEYVSEGKREKIFTANLHYFHNHPGLGHIFNWNAAISHAAGEYIKIMFSDDWFTEETSLEKMVSALEEKPQAVLCFTGSMQVSKQGQYPRGATPEYIQKLREHYSYLFCSNLIGAPSDTLYRRSTGAMFDEKSNWASDVFLYFEILKNGGDFVYLDEPLISIGVHENQYTESFGKRDERIYQDYKYMFEKYQLLDVPECREHFLVTYLMPYHKSGMEASGCGYSMTGYYRRYLPYFWEDTVCSYARAALRKIGIK